MGPIPGGGTGGVGRVLAVAIALTHPFHAPGGSMLERLDGAVERLGPGRPRSIPPELFETIWKRSRVPKYR